MSGRTERPERLPHPGYEHTLAVVCPVEDADLKETRILIGLLNAGYEIINSSVMGSHRDTVLYVLRREKRHGY